MNGKESSGNSHAIQNVFLEDVPDAIENILNDFLKESYDVRQEALMKGATFLKEKLEEAAPENTGEYKQCFVIEAKHGDHKYVGNTKHVKDPSSNNIPLSNILEYTGHAHIRPTFDSNEEAIFQIIKNSILGGK